MTYTTALQPTKPETCADCPQFNNFNESGGRGWCNLFDHYVRQHHEKTQTCSNSLTASPKQNLNIFADYSPEELEQLREQAFPSKVIELDRDGYPMGNETVENGYFDQSFVTLPNEPF